MNYSESPVALLTWVLSPRQNLSPLADAMKRWCALASWELTGGVSDLAHCKGPHYAKPVKAWLFLGICVAQDNKCYSVPLVLKTCFSFGGRISGSVLRCVSSVANAQNS